MSKYCCTNCDLQDHLEIIKSPKGINAIWNKDDNTVYYNPKIFHTEQLKHLDPEYRNHIKDNDIKIHPGRPSQITEEAKDFYKAINQSRINNLNKNICFKKV